MSKATAKSRKKAGPTRQAKEVIARKPLSDILVVHPPVPKAPALGGEHTVDFNKYIVVYSNNFDGNLSSTWRAGETSISCYKDDAFVGVISFYESAERMGGGYIDANGVFVVEFPVEKFGDIMRTLKTFSSLSLLFVEKDLSGTPLAHRVGALMTFQKKLIGT